MTAAVQQQVATLPLQLACVALGLSRATFYRDQQPTAPKAPRVPRRVARKLALPEREQVLELLHQERFVDQPPAEIVAQLLSEGVYVASVRTFYRILAAADEGRERRALASHPPAAKPVLVARGPNQVWTWDITKLAGPAPGTWFYLYVLLDLFSRYAVGWLLAERENGTTAARWLREVIAHRAVDPEALQLHNDRGSPMTSVPFTQLVERLGIAHSFSRPRVSDDNAFSEAQFRTLKYQPDYPARFGSLLHAQGWVEEFFAWYHEHHHHAGLALFTPAEVYEGRVEPVAMRRQCALDAAYAAHPERFVNGAPTVKRPPAEVWINPVSTQAIPSSEPAPQASLCPSPAQGARDHAQTETRAPKAARAASEPLPRSSMGARSTERRAEVPHPRKAH
jgi:putative transposase